MPRWCSERTDTLASETSSHDSLSASFLSRFFLSHFSCERAPRSRSTMVEGSRVTARKKLNITPATQSMPNCWMGGMLEMPKETKPKAVVAAVRKTATPTVTTELKMEAWGSLPLRLSS